MKKILLAFFIVVSTISLSQSQNKKLEVYIQQTGTITDEDEGVEISASSDDAEQENDAMDDLYDDDLDVGYEYDPSEINIVNIGLRFRGITIPAGATIDSAFIYVHSHEGKSADDVANITITGEANPNTETFSMESLITDRPRTTSSARWEIAEEWGLYTKHRTPDITAIVQEIIDQEGWELGNALSIIMEGENQGVSENENAREIESFENIADPEDGGDGQNHPERVPQLVVYYTVNTTSVLGKAFKKELSVYPNPVEKELLNIEVAAGSFNQVSVYNITGKLLKSLKINSSINEIDVSDLNKGLYIIRVTGNASSVSAKVVIK